MSKSQKEGVLKPLNAIFATMHTYQQAGNIFADAFIHYPLMQYAFEGKNRRAQNNLKLLFKTDK